MLQEGLQVWLPQIGLCEQKSQCFFVCLFFISRWNQVFLREEHRASVDWVTCCHVARRWAMNGMRLRYSQFRSDATRQGVNSIRRLFPFISTGLVKRHDAWVANTVIFLRGLETRNTEGFQLLATGLLSHTLTFELFLAAILLDTLIRSTFKLNAARVVLVYTFIDDTFESPAARVAEIQFVELWSCFGYYIVLNWPMARLAYHLRTTSSNGLIISWHIRTFFLVVLEIATALNWDAVQHGVVGVSGVNFDFNLSFGHRHHQTLFLSLCLINSAWNLRFELCIAYEVRAFFDPSDRLFRLKTLSCALFARSVYGCLHF